MAPPDPDRRSEPLLTRRGGARWTDDPALRSEFEALLLALSRAIHQMRSVAGLSQEGYAKESGVDADTLLGIEQTRTDPRLSTVMRLARARGLRLELHFVHGPALPSLPEDRRVNRAPARVCG